MTNKELNIYLIDSDTLPVCPLCGARTSFDELDNSTQLHQCLNCSHQFICCECDDYEECEDYEESECDDCEEEGEDKFENDEDDDKEFLL